MANYGDCREFFTCIMYGSTYGESFAKDLADKIKERFQIGNVKVGWTTTDQDVFGTMTRTMDNSVCSFFIYTEEMKEKYGEWFEHATKLALTEKKKIRPIFIIIKPYSTEKLHRDNKYMSTYDPIDFDANYLRSEDQWQRLLNSIEGMAKDWLRDHDRVLNQDPEERNLLDEWRRFLQDNWPLLCTSALVSNLEDRLFSDHIIDLDLMDRMKNPALIKRERMQLVLERVIRSPSTERIKKFVKILEKLEVEVFKIMKGKMTLVVRCDYEGKSPPKAKKISQPILVSAEERGETSMEVDAADSGGRSEEQSQSIDSTNSDSFDSCHECKEPYTRQNCSFCTSCGVARKRARECSKCKADVTEEEKYCHNCGTKQ